MMLGVGIVADGHEREDVLAQLLLDLIQFCDHQRSLGAKEDGIKRVNCRYVRNPTHAMQNQQPRSPLSLVHLLPQRHQRVQPRLAMDAQHEVAHQDEIRREAA